MSLSESPGQVLRLRSAKKIPVRQLPDGENNQPNSIGLAQKYHATWVPNNQPWLAWALAYGEGVNPPVLPPSWIGVVAPFQELLQIEQVPKTRNSGRVKN